MLITATKIWHKLNYFYHVSPALLMKRLAVKLISPVYRHEVGYITLITTEGYDAQKWNEDPAAVGVVINSPESLQFYENRISPLFPLNELTGHLAGTGGNIVVLAVKTSADGSVNEVAGYRKLQQGVFSDDWGIECELADDALFVLYTEVLPKYRGQRIGKIMVDATMDYCRENGFKKVIGVIAAHNQPVLAHFHRLPGSRIIGKIEMVSILNGFYKHITPCFAIKKIIEQS